MCGRFSLMARLDELTEELKLVDVPPFFEPKDQIPPGTGIAIMTDARDRKLDFYYWGLIPSWAKDVTIGRKTFNARSETILERPAFRNSFKRRRALIPATSYYEWRTRNGVKEPFRFSVADEKIFTFAGIWDYWMDANGNEVYSASILTTTPNAAVSPYHTRMPVIISRKDRERWMTTDDLETAMSYLKPISSDRVIIEAVKKISEGSPDPVVSSLPEQLNLV